MSLACWNLEDIQMKGNKPVPKDSISDAESLDNQYDSYNPTGRWLGFARMVIGAWWIYEVTIGKYWKTGSLTSGVNPVWIGPGAGDAIKELGEMAIGWETWGWFEWLLNNLFFPYAADFSYLVVALQLAVGILLIFGAFTRTMSLVGIVIILPIILMGFSHTPPWLLVGSLFLIATNAGLYCGVDGMLLRKVEDNSGKGAGLLRFSVTLNLEALKRKHLLLLGSVSAILAVYYLLQVPQLTTPRIQLVSLEFSVVLGLMAVGFYTGSNRNTSATQTALSLLRMYVGYRFIWTVVASPAVKITGMPGLANPEELSLLFQQAAESHWAPIAYILTNGFAPAAPFWSIFLGAIQIVIGLMLIIGWQTRVASLAGVLVLVFYIALGFTRYAPYLLSYTLVVWALDAGRALSMDSLIHPNRQTRFSLPFARFQTFGFGIVAIAALILANFLGVTPNGYNSVKVKAENLIEFGQGSDRPD